MHVKEIYTAVLFGVSECKVFFIYIDTFTQKVCIKLVKSDNDIYTKNISIFKLCPCKL